MVSVDNVYFMKFGATLPVADYNGKLSDIPRRTLYTGASLPAIGFGTFGSDHVSGVQMADAVRGAIDAGYRHLDCAAVYGNENLIGPIIRDSRVPREEFWITSKLWNDQHSSVRDACRKSLADLRIGHLD